MKVQRVLAVITFSFGISQTFVAQQHGSWSDLNGLHAGEHIQVIETNMKRHDGKFVAVTDELLSLRETGTDISIRRNDVARVSTSSGGNRGKHAVIGLLIGAGAGAAIGAASGSSNGFLGGSSRGLTALAGIVIGAPSGAIVGAVLPAHATIYRASPENTQQSAQQ